MRKFRKSQVGLWIVLLLMGVVFLLPFVVMVSTSFEYFTFSLPFPPRLFPKEPVFDNYIEIFQTQNILRYFGNSVIMALITPMLAITVSSFAAYAFARLRFPGKEAIFKLFLFTLMIPGILNIIPQFITISRLGLIGKRAGLVLLYMGTGAAGSAFFLRGFYESIPRHIDESVMLDGGNHWTIFSKMYVPLALPGMATMAYFCVQGTWEDFFTAKVILAGNEKILTLPIMLHRLNGLHSTKFGLVFAAAIITLLPIIILYTIVQRRFIVGGIMKGSAKM